MKDLSTLRKIELTRRVGWERQTADFLSDIIVVLLAIVAYLVRIVLKMTVKFKKQLYKLAILIFVLYGLYSAFLSVTYAPYAKADGTKPFITRTDYTVKEIVLSMGRYEFGEDQVPALEQIISHESNFDPNAVNPNSGSCGLFQSLPCSKMKSMSLQDQVQFGLDYIQQRYQTPANAWAFWRVHHWY